MRDYYTYDTIEFDPVVDPNIDRGPFINKTPYGVQYIEILTPEQARKEISDAESFEKRSYRDGGSFEIVTKDYKYEFHIGSGHTEEGYHTYNPWIRKTHWIK